MSNSIDIPGRDVPTPIIPDEGDSDVIGRPDDGDGIGNDLPTKPLRMNPASEPDSTTPGPSVPEVQRTN